MKKKQSEIGPRKAIAKRWVPPPRSDAAHSKDGRTAMRSREAERYWQLAREMRRRAVTVGDLKINRAMLKIAEDYEAFTDLVDEIDEQKRAMIATLQVYLSDDLLRFLHIGRQGGPSRGRARP